MTSCERERGNGREQEEGPNKVDGERLTSIIESALIQYIIEFQSAVQNEHEHEQKLLGSLFESNTSIFH